MARVDCTPKMRQEETLHFAGKGSKVEKRRSNGWYTEEFRRYAVERMKASANITALAEELGVPRIELYRWRRRLDPLPSRAASYTPDKDKVLLCQQLEQVKQLLAEKTMEVDFFKGALQKVEARGQKSSSTGVTASTSKSGK
jgi:Transposase